MQYAIIRFRISIHKNQKLYLIQIIDLSLQEHFQLCKSENSPSLVLLFPFLKIAPWTSCFDRLPLCVYIHTMVLKLAQICTLASVSN